MKIDKQILMRQNPQELSRDDIRILVDRNNIEERSMVLLRLLAEKFGETSYSEAELFQMCGILDYRLALEILRRCGLIELATVGWLPPFDLKVLVDVPEEHKNNPISYLCESLSNQGSNMDDKGEN